MTDIVAKRDAGSEENEELLRNIKRPKTDKDLSETMEGSDSQSVLSEFKTSKILSESAREKTIFIHGKVTLYLHPILIGIKHSKLHLGFLKIKASFLEVV